MTAGLLAAACILLALRFACVTARELAAGRTMKAPLPEKVALRTPYGKIVLNLLPDNAPKAVAAVQALAKSRGCKTCNFYRAEARPLAAKKEAPTGPPYALLQGQLDLPDIPEHEGAIQVKTGHAAFIPNSKDFFIALGDHPEWGSRSHTVFGKVVDFVSTDLIAIQPYNQIKHPQHGTVMRMMKDPVKFNITTDILTL